MINVGQLLEDADTSASQVRCLTCKWVATRPDEEAREWTEALDGERYTSAQIARAMAKVNDEAPSMSSVVNHRGDHRRSRSNR